MKTVNIEQKPTSFFLPADDLRAAFQCIGTEQMRLYLCGVFIDTTNRKLVALDGHQMLTIDMPDGCFVGSACLTQKGGFILSCDAADKAFKAKPSGGNLWVYGDTETGILQFVTYSTGDSECPRLGVLQFTSMGGTFPNWQRLVAKGDGGTGTMCYDPAVLARLVKAANVIAKGRAIRLTSGKTTDDPIRVEFKASDRMLGTLMPVWWDKA